MSVAAPAVAGATVRRAGRELLVLGAVVTAVLLGVAAGYGPHRDELYFLRAGAEPAWGYADQPPLTPLLAHALDVAFGGSLVGLRAPSALMAGLVVVLTGLVAGELGADRGAQLLTAGAMAVSAFLLAVGHLLSTSTLDLLVWTVLSWLIVRGVRGGGPIWLVVGLVAGIGLENKWQPAFLLAGLLVSVLAVAPRAVLRTHWPWLGGLIALALWVPNLVWQAAHGFPQLQLSAAIAAGSSGTSQPWWAFLPYQLVLVSPLLAPIWLIGLWRLARDPALGTWRAFALAWVLLAALFIATGGKPYYLAGLSPVLLAAGAPPALAWARITRVRMQLLGGAFAVAAALNAVLMLPVVPATALATTPIPAINYDAGETVGWPQFAATVAAVRAELLDTRVAVLARNYGEAGAVDHYLPALGPAHSGHNSYWDWGPPADDTTAVIVIGYRETQLRAWFGHVDLATHIDNRLGLHNDEQGAAVWIARNRLAPWTQIWPQFRHLG
ncbi:MAG: glycosyltransferase family 39 protein [Pseudonocardiaceae bacterium]